MAAHVEGPHKLWLTFSILGETSNILLTNFLQFQHRQDSLGVVILLYHKSPGVFKHEIVENVDQLRLQQILTTEVSEEWSLVSKGRVQSKIQILEKIFFALLKVWKKEERKKRKKFSNKPQVVDEAGLATALMSGDKESAAFCSIRTVRSDHVLQISDHFFYGVECVVLILREFNLQTLPDILDENIEN